MKKRTKPTPKRHAKPKPPRVRAAPSALQRIDARLESLCELAVHVGTLATHCERLLREKETLMKENARLLGEAAADSIPHQPWEPPMAPLDTANTFMAAPKRQAG